MTAEVLRRPRGRPAGGMGIEARIWRDESHAAWGRVIQLGNRVHLATIAERPDVALAAAGELIHIGERRLRQIGPRDAA